MARKIPIPTTSYHKIVNIAGVAAHVGTSALLILRWGRIPEQIPAHFNAAGVIDRWGGKAELWAFQLISLLLYAGITVLERFPQIWNTGVTVTEQNRDRVYRDLKSMIVTLKLAIVLTFGLLTLYSSMAKPLPGWFLPADLALIFGPMIYFCIRLTRKNKSPAKGEEL